MEIFLQMSMIKDDHFLYGRDPSHFDRLNPILVSICSFCSFCLFICLNYVSFISIKFQTDENYWNQMILNEYALSSLDDTKWIYSIWFFLLRFETKWIYSFSIIFCYTSWWYYVSILIFKIFVVFILKYFLLHFLMILDFILYVLFLTIR